MVGWLSPSHSKYVQSNGISTTSSTLDTHVSNRLCTNSSDRCCAQLKLILPIHLPPMTLMSFFTTWHGQFTVPITWYLKPPQRKPFLDVTCSLTFHLWQTGTKLESGGNHWPFMAISARTLMYWLWLQGRRWSTIDKWRYPLQSRVHIHKEPWIITTVHMNGTIRIQCRTRTEWLSIQRVQPFADDIL